MFAGDHDLLPFIKGLVEAGREINSEDVEPEISHIVRDFIDLYFSIAKWRGYGEFGPHPLTLGNLRDYCLFYDVVIESWLADLLKRMDDIFFEERFKKRGKQD